MPDSIEIRLDNKAVQDALLNNKISEMESLKNINFVTALVSIVVLQVAMFQAFAPEQNLGFANALTGGGVSAIILVLGILMIIKANKKLKEIKKNEQTNENK